MPQNECKKLMCLDLKFKATYLFKLASIDHAQSPYVTAIRHMIIKLGAKEKPRSEKAVKNILIITMA